MLFPEGHDGIGEPLKVILNYASVDLKPHLSLVCAALELGSSDPTNRSVLTLRGAGNTSGVSDLFLISCGSSNASFGIRTSLRLDGVYILKCDDTPGLMDRGSGAAVMPACFANTGRAERVDPSILRRLNWLRP
jgi:hypothetical protein